MKIENKMPLAENRIRDLGLFLAEFAMDFVPPRDNVRSYTANDFYELINEWFRDFIRYAETNGMFLNGEKEALLNNELVTYVKEAAIGSAREIALEK
jgi:hypothetical protein